MKKQKELTFEEFCAMPMRMVMHINGDKENYLHRFNDELRVSTITITKKNKYGQFTTSSYLYIFDDDKRNFQTADQVYLAYMEKVCGVKHDTR